MIIKIALTLSRSSIIFWFYLQAERGVGKSIMLWRLSLLELEFWSIEHYFTQLLCRPLIWYSLHSCKIRWFDLSPSSFRYLSFRCFHTDSSLASFFCTIWMLSLKLCWYKPIFFISLFKIRNLITLSWCKCHRVNFLRIIFPIKENF